MIVYTFEHRILERDRRTWTSCRVALASAKQFGNRVLLVQRHQFRAQFVVWRVQGNRQRHVADFAELVDHRHQTGSGQGDALVGQAESKIVAHHAHRTHDIVEVKQRLAHAHHHDVGQLALQMRHVAQMPGGNEYLTDDFRGRKIAIETLRPGRTERAGQAATDLRRHAQRAARGFGDEYGFDRIAAIHAE